MKTHITLATYRKEAREALKGKWIYAATATLLWFTLSSILSSMITIFVPVRIIFGSILTYGYVYYSYNLAVKERANIEDIFAGFSNRFSTILFASLIMIIRTLLWTLLFIIPGIIAAISYSQTLLIIKHNPNIDAYQAVEQSKKMMHGHKWRYFLLILSFVPWILLSTFTFFIGLFFVVPYIYVAIARFYIHLKNHTKTAEIV